jgi:hypothetical protein
MSFRLTHLLFGWLASWSTVSLKKLKIIQILKKFPAIYKTKCLLQGLRELATCSMNPLHKYPSHFCKIHFNIILITMTRYFKEYLLFTALFSYSTYQKRWPLHSSWYYDLKQTWLFVATGSYSPTIFPLPIRSRCFSQRFSPITLGAVASRGVRDQVTRPQRK